MTPDEESRKSTTEDSAGEPREPCAQRPRMNAPDFDRVLETFIRTPLPENPAPLHQIQGAWSAYMDFLRRQVAPLVRDLMDKEIIDWYSFLIHTKDNGVPTTDDSDYVHLRMSYTESSTEEELRASLPPECEKTQPMKRPVDLGSVDIQSLGGVEEGYRILGEASEWVLRMLEAHDPNSDVSAETVGQFLHYIGNQIVAKGAPVEAQRTFFVRGIPVVTEQTLLVQGIPVP